MATAEDVGPALNLTDEQLDQLAEITEEDILETNRLWSASVPQWAVNLLLAEQVNG